MAKSQVRAVPVPAGVDVAIAPAGVTVKGKHGELELTLRHGVTVVKENGSLVVNPRTNGRNDRALAGTVQSLIRNMVHGVTELWQRKLVLSGTGYRARIDGKVLNLQVGYSNPQEFPIPDDVSIETPAQTEILVSGIDRQRVGQVAAEIRAVRPPEVYKGKGIRYDGEYIRRKEGKKKGTTVA